MDTKEKDCDFREFYLTDELKKAIVTAVEKQILPLMIAKRKKVLQDAADQLASVKTNIESNTPFFGKLNALLLNDLNGLSKDGIEEFLEAKEAVLNQMAYPLIKQHNLVTIRKEDIAIELELFSTTKDMSNCVDAYDVIDALVEFYTEEYELAE